MKKFELRPDGRQKSFYGKAIVTEYSKDLAILTSYNTEVAAIKNGEFIRLWDGWSATTQKHINAFLNLYGVAGGGKEHYINTPVTRRNLIVDIIKAIRSDRTA